MILTKKEFMDKWTPILGYFEAKRLVAIAEIKATIEASLEREEQELADNWRDMVDNYKVPSETELVARRMRV